MTWVLATEHIPHRHGIGKMKHIDVAHLWLQDEVKSNRLRVRRVKSEDDLADTGTKAPGNKIIRKRAISMGYVVVKENLRLGDAMGSGLANQSKRIKADQPSRKRHWNQLPGHARQHRCSSSEGSQVSPRVTKRDDSKSDVSPLCGPFPHQPTESDAAASWIADVSMVPQLEKLSPQRTTTRCSSTSMDKV